MFRRIMLVLSVALVALVPTALFAGSAQAAPQAAVGGGTAIVFGGKAACTMTAVGRDRSGTLVGLSAAHCAKGGHTITAQNRRSVGVIGRVALISRAGDYAVIRLDPSRVRAVRSVGQARITGIGAMPAFGTTVCKMGRTTGFTCGPVLDAGRPLSTGYVCAGPGDSGAPVLHGTRLVGMLNGGEIIGGVAIACPFAGFPVHSPMVATRITSILAALNRHGQIGAGFRPI